MPDTTDAIASKLWISDFNSFIRYFKTWADNVWEDLIQIKKAEETINSARETIDKTNELIEKTKTTVETKIDQTEKVIEKTEEVIKTTKELKEDFDNLTDFSWSTWTTSLSWEIIE